MSGLFRRDSRELLVLAVAVCVLLAQDQDEDSLGVMAAFFDVIADVLALFALQPDLRQHLCGTDKEEAPQSVQGATTRRAVFPEKSISRGIV